MKEKVGWGAVRCLVCTWAGVHMGCPTTAPCGQQQLLCFKALADLTPTAPDLDLS